jgi:hypothetical protein
MIIKTPLAEYPTAVLWIVRNRAGAGGWPPTDVTKVSGWTVTRLVADVFKKAHLEVARDIIDCAQDASPRASGK